MEEVRLPTYLPQRTEATVFPMHGDLQHEKHEHRGSVNRTTTAGEMVHYLVRGLDDAEAREKRRKK